MSSPSQLVRSRLHGSSSEFLPLSNELASPELERAFRAWSHADHARRVRTALWVASALMGAFVPAELAYLGWTATFAALAAARIALGGVGVLLAQRVATTAPRNLDRRLGLWTLVAVVVVLASVATRPPGFQPHVITVSAAMLIIYTLLPNRVPTAALVGGGFGVGYLIVVARTGGIGRDGLGVIALGLLLVNAIGVTAGGWLARLARSEFLRLRAAEEAHAARLAFLAATSHEIRSPLHGIVACVDLLSGTGPTSEQRELLGLIRCCSDGMVGLLEEAVHQVRGDGAPPPIHPGVMDLRGFVDEIGALVKARAAVNAVRVSLRIGDDVPRWALSDRGRLRQILLNLAENALAHGARERIEIFAEVGARLTDGRVPLVLGVIDDGPGVREAMREAIFRPFVQAGPADRAGRGMGLGLAICDRLARAMDGRMEVDDAPGGGARFRLHVPVEEAPAPPGASAPRRAPVPRRRLEVLVVEDDAVSRHLMSLLLEREGHRVTLASSAEQALDEVAARPYDTVLMDIRLPGMDGVEAARRIRALGEERGALVPVIAMSAHVARADHDQLLRAGCAAILPKPVDLERLRAALAWVTPGEEPGPAPSGRGAAAEPPLLDEARLDAIGRAIGGARVARLLAVFVETSAPVLQALGAAAEAGQLDAVAALAHRLAGAAESAALAQCGRAAAVVEDEARAGRAIAVDALDRLRRAHEASTTAALARAEALGGRAGLSVLS